ncbi:response regulator [Pontibacter sp. H259]|uniref:response regulator n=1 Tax=Pontibacter sp. H259 TaxID=3133421 RepID=UPI0030C64E49
MWHLYYTFSELARCCLINPLSEDEKKILLVDNDTTYLYIVKQLLKKHAIVGETVTAENGLEALEILKTDHRIGEMPQIIITDMEMPIMDGTIFLKELAALKLIDHTFTKIVVNSSNTQYTTMNWTLKIPAPAFFQKPLLAEHILTILGG